MRASDLARLITLAAIWGAVFLGEPVGVSAVILLATALVLELGQHPGARRRGTIPASRQ